jgi:hypothetical protein
VCSSDLGISTFLTQGDSGNDSGGRKLLPGDDTGFVSTPKKRSNDTGVSAAEYTLYYALHNASKLNPLQREIMMVIGSISMLLLNTMARFVPISRCIFRISTPSFIVLAFPDHLAYYHT